MGDRPERLEQADQDRALRLMFSIALPPGRPAFAERLEQLRDASGAVLSEGQYRQLRGEILNDLVSSPRFPALLALVLVILLLGMAAIAVNGLYSGDHGLVLVGGIPALLTLVFGYRIHRHTVAKRSLSRTERMEVVEELLSLNLISPTEAEELEAEIERLPSTVRTA